MQTKTYELKNFTNVDLHTNVVPSTCPCWGDFSVDCVVVVAVASMQTSAALALVSVPLAVCDDGFGGTVIEICSIRGVITWWI